MTLDDSRPYPGITVSGHVAQTSHASAAEFLCLSLTVLIVRLPNLLTGVFRTMSGRLAFGDPPSQETQPQMRAGHGG
jgi:hypothetical protein